MRFCFVTTFYPPEHFGGDALVVRALARELVRRGHRVEVVCCSDAYRLRGKPRDVDPDTEGVVVHRLRSRVGALSPIVTQQTGHPGFKSRALRRVLAGEFDVVNFHNVSLVGGPSALRLARAPVVAYTLHEHWLVCPTHVLWKNRSQACDRPTCLSCSIRSGVPPQLWRYTSRIERSLAHVDVLLSPSEFTARHHRERGIDRPIRVLPLFSALDPGEAAGGDATSPPEVVYVGRLTESKGVVELVRAFRERPDLRLTIAGAGEAEEEVRRARGDAAHIRMLGHVDHDDLPALYRSAAAAIVPSLGPETFGMAAVEAMACGTPVIVREAGGSGEVLDHGGGILYRTRSQLLAAVTELVANPDLRARLAREARAAYEEHFTIGRYVRDYLGILEGLGAHDSELRS